MGKKHKGRKGSDGAEPEHEHEREPELPEPAARGEGEGGEGEDADADATEAVTERSEERVEINTDPAEREPPSVLEGAMLPPVAVSDPPASATVHARADERRSTEQLERSERWEGSLSTGELHLNGMHTSPARGPSRLGPAGSKPPPAARPSRPPRPPSAGPSFAGFLHKSGTGTPQPAEDPSSPGAEQYAKALQPQRGRVTIVIDEDDEADYVPPPAVGWGAGFLRPAAAAAAAAPDPPSPPPLSHGPTRSSFDDDVSVESPRAGPSPLQQAKPAEILATGEESVVHVTPEEMEARINQLGIQMAHNPELSWLYADDRPSPPKESPPPPESEPADTAASWVDQTGLCLVPPAVNGLALGVVALGLLWRDPATQTAFDADARQAEAWAAACAGVALALVLVYALKVVLVAEVLALEVLAPQKVPGVITAPMALLLASQALLPYGTLLAQVLWRIGYVLFVVGFVVYAVAILREVEYKGYSKMELLRGFTPPMVVPLVGIGLAAFTSDGMAVPDGVARASFWIALVNCIWAMPVQGLRVMLLKERDPVKYPLLSILVAPQAVVIMGLIAQYQNPSILFTNLLGATTYLTYVGMLIGFGPRLLRMPFNWSWCCTTFPLAAVASSLWKYYAEAERSKWLQVLAMAQTILSTAAIVGVFLRCSFLFVEAAFKHFRSVMYGVCEPMDRTANPLHDTRQLGDHPNPLLEPASPPL